MILGGNKPVQRPASNSDARKRREGVVGESSTDALRGAPRSLRESFNAYVSATNAASRAYAGYQYGDVSEAEVGRLARLEHLAYQAHIEAMDR